MAYEGVGDTAKAIVHYRRAIDCDPTMPPDDPVRLKLKVLKK